MPRAVSSRQHNKHKNDDDQKVQVFTVRGPVSESRFVSTRRWNGASKNIYLFGDNHTNASTCDSARMTIGQFLLREIKINRRTQFDLFFEAGPRDRGGDDHFLSDAIRVFKDHDLPNARVHWADARTLDTPLRALDDFITAVHTDPSHFLDHYVHEDNVLLWRLLHPQKSDTAAVQANLILKEFHRHVVPLNYSEPSVGKSKVKKQLLSNLPRKVLALLLRHLNQLITRIREESQKKDADLVFPRDTLSRLETTVSATKQIENSSDLSEATLLLRLQEESDGLAYLQDLHDQFMGSKSLVPRTRPLSLRPLIEALISWQMDAYLFARMFRRFVATNVIVYAGDHHIGLYKSWLAELGFVKKLSRRSDISGVDFQCMQIPSPMF